MISRHQSGRCREKVQGDETVGGESMQGAVSIMKEKIKMKVGDGGV